MNVTADWLSAIATSAAVVVALFQDDISRLWRKPRLVPSIELKAPDCNLVEQKQADERYFSINSDAACYYFRIWIENKGKERAENVQVFARKLERLGGKFEEVQSFVPMNLCWSYGQQRAQGPEIFAEAISPGMGKHCDLMHIVEPGKRGDPSRYHQNLASNEVAAALDLESHSRTLPSKNSILIPGAYRLTLRIAAANFSPIDWTLEINIQREWHNETEIMFSPRGITIKAVE